ELHRVHRGAAHDRRADGRHPLQPHRQAPAEHQGDRRALVKMGGHHMAPRTPPRIFGIPAARAPIVAVLRRGPSDWSHVGRWDVAAGVYEPGAWIRANLYPQRCDLSPDGRWLCYFTLKGGAHWAAGDTYVAISRSEE